MEISLRLETIAKMVENCDAVADIGTDHGYIPIYLIKKQICKKAIASDINKGPVKKAKFNIAIEGLENKAETRLGGGLSTLRPGEVDVAIIAGMGGNLIRDILEESLEVFKKLQYVVLQPVQNPEIVREHIYAKGYTILDEDLCLDEGKYYEVLKIKFDTSTPKQVKSVYYEIGQKLMEKKHPLVRSYIEYKLDKYKKILYTINEQTKSAKMRKNEIEIKISQLEELLQCL